MAAMSQSGPMPPHHPYNHRPGLASFSSEFPRSGHPLDIATGRYFSDGQFAGPPAYAQEPPFYGPGFGPGFGPGHALPPGDHPPDHGGGIAYDGGMRPTGGDHGTNSFGQQPPRPPFNQGGYMPNGAPGGVGSITPAPLLPNQGRIIQTGPIRLLCIADVRGHLRTLNDLAKQARADHIIHTGDFGFYDDTSLERIADKTLKHVAQYSPLISEPVRKAIGQGGPGPVKSRFRPQELPLSELALLLNGQLKLDVPVYTVWGACEDVRVLEKFRSGEYKVNNLHIIDEARSMLLELGGVKLRLLGLGGAVVMHKLFDNGEGRTTIAGGQGTMWTTLLQMGELVDTANRVYDPTETRVFITHASPAREGILNQLSVSLKSDFSISAGLHFRYGSSYNEFSVNPTLDHYRGKLAASKASFNDVWETVKSEVEPAIQANEAQQNLLKNALNLVDKMPTTAAGGNPFGGPVASGSGAAALGQVDESAFKNMWNFNLADAAFGWLVLEIQDGRIGTEMRAQGFNFSHRGAKQQASASAASALATASPAANSPSPAPGSDMTGTSHPPASSVPSSVPSGPSHPASSHPASSHPAPPTGPARNTPTGPAKSLAPVPMPQTQKPATPKPNAPTPTPAQGSAPPQPSAAPSTKENERPVGVNGTTTGGPDPVPSPAPRNNADAIGLFVHNIQSDDAARDLIPGDYKGKITRIEARGANNRVLHFSTAEERDAALNSLPEEFKTRPKGEEDRSKPLVKLFNPNSNARFPPRGGAGNWGSSRGNPSLSSGYRSNPDRGTMSGGESGPESGRGRGRGGRGGDRGGRGRGGRGGGRGGMKSGEGGSGSPALASSTPAGDY